MVKNTVDPVDLSLLGSRKAGIEFGMVTLTAAQLAMLRRRCHRCRSPIPIRSLNTAVEAI